MRAFLVAALLLTLAVAVPAATAEPPQPGAKCHVVEEYVTEAYASGSVTDGTFWVYPGAPRPVECYY